MIDIGHQAARFFDDSSLSRGQTPKLVVISGEFVQERRPCGAVTIVLGSSLWTPRISF
jgi:hypothetical protein